ncbi:DUF1820 family protein [Porticoccus sp.]|uniref:DUF1820 family protein n=1 Tax=Porticoccus sp. TaxID=2024853 RepID=UPI000C59012A|nr:DUF1820 family protein [Porticoccus sp.]MAZ71280.1 hypothetical protein [Porticoccus sp.]|tara:strand:+ start:2971 stop:3312 length:342 start_codon:yes stop_codon:yes gene_type:complete
MASTPIYKIVFFNQGQVYEIYARQVYQSDLWGFLEVEEFVFGERSQMIVDPSEEKLKNEFSSVKRSFIPLHSVVRIDEVEKEGSCKIIEAKGGAGNVTPFPYAGLAPKPKSDR